MKYSSSFVSKYMVLWDWFVCFFIVNLLIIQNRSFVSSKETNTINVVEIETLGDHQSILVGYYNFPYSIFQYIYLFPCLFQLPTEMLDAFLSAQYGSCYFKWYLISPQEITSPQVCAKGLHPRLVILAESEIYSAGITAGCTLPVKYLGMPLITGRF